MKVEFQSFLFSLGSLDKENLRGIGEDTANISKVDNNYDWRPLLDKVKEILLLKTERETIEQLNIFGSSNLVPNLQTAISCFRFIRFFLGKMAEETVKDTPEVILSDLEKISDLPGEKEKALVLALLKLLKEEVPWYKNLAKIKDYEAGLFPFLRGIGTTVELRGVFDKKFHIGEKADKAVAEIKDKKIEVVPVISIALTLDSGDPSRFCFQVSLENARWFIEELKFALYKCEEMNKQHGVN